ncbi:MAG: hypothetical protein IPP93_09800 [Chitinophagaceae bacterium]|nr:hypothetical protein [Chitinophagaceae bacterium]
MKKLPLYITFLLFTAAANAQVRFSLCNDLGLQRSFKKGQQYWAGGHTLSGDFHFTSTDAAYFWISYYTEGKFKNNLIATAKSPSTTPQQVNYVNNALMRFKQFSLGWKKFLKGSFDADKSWNMYGFAGFGIILGKVTNTHSVSIDSNVYVLPVRSGKANFKRLTIDVGLGAEWPMGSDFFVYSELRAWLPTTSYPSKYVFVNRDAPIVGMLNFGLRILF